MKRTELGFETVSQGPPAVYRDADNDPQMLTEAQMLTRDENVVNNSMIVRYKIRDSIAYLFNIPEGTLQGLAEAAERQVVGNRPSPNKVPFENLCGILAWMMNEKAQRIWTGRKEPRTVWRVYPLRTCLFPPPYLVY